MSSMASLLDIFTTKMRERDAMQADKLCHKLFESASIKLHKTRLKLLIDAVTSLTNCSELTLTSLGRSMPGTTKQKHKIKRVDRLLNNSFIYSDKIKIYKACFNLFVSNPLALTIIVDWSPYQHKRTHGLLRASCVFDGRSITVYEELHDYADVMRIKTQSQFMNAVKEILPESCDVTVVTDAGFCRPWFKLIESLGWNFIGRLRVDVKFKNKDGIWNKLEQLEKQATISPKEYRQTLISIKNPYCVTIITKRKNRKEQKNEYSSVPTIKQYQKQAKTSWLLATSLTVCRNRIIKIYSKRMQIETGFRDCKSKNFGLGLLMARHCTPCLVRRSILLIIAHLAILTLLLLGFLAESKSWQYDFQSNSVKRRRVLSYVSLGKEVLRNYLNKVKMRDLKQALCEIKIIVGNAAAPRFFKLNQAITRQLKIYKENIA